ncbi:MAG: TAXI family TRAP transporter solute-binding subunit [Natronospirillum sp.]|uniref:TAXI family TRAP transporter solute-binding subunit n=1 Tax=Natronospirillum sp. TaxID=2812955 RepID=UPI0025E0AF86|nr:TAXI family TRAP transporter solute-binding subunit [Natronospirillum sp.]MCH8551149.1 TAXI family TRAP transporter solute-binding subunit [Natronospirillum sp.]
MKTRKSAMAKLATVGLAMSMGLAAGNAAANEFISIGTGGVTGVYYPVGGAICRLVNANRSEHGIRCGVESTGGSIFNTNTIRDGELDFGIVQSDVQYNAINGEVQFEGDAYEDMRAVFALHVEAFTVVAREDAGVSEFDELEGMRVNVGNPGSGQRATLEQLLELQDKDFGVYSQASDLVASQMAAAMCDNQVDAIIYVVGHPSGAIEEATTSCPGKLVNVTGSAVEQMLNEFPYYAATTIPGGMYSGNPDDIETFGVGATLVTAASVSDDVVYELTKAVFENLDSFKDLHPALSTLDAESMMSEGLSAPLHPGAERYYREAGMM